MLKTQIRTASDLRAFVEVTGSDFFSRKTMKFFGDSMKNYGVRRVRVECTGGEQLEAFELYRRRPVKFGLDGSSYFCANTFKRLYLAKVME